MLLFHHFLSLRYRFSPERILISSFYIGLIAIPPCSPPQALARARDPIKDLAAIWKCQSEEVATANIRYRLFRWGAQVKPLTSGQLNQLVASVDLAKRPDDLAKIIEGLLVQPLAAQPPWSVIQAYFEGSKAREQHMSTSSSVQVYDGKERVEYDALNNQATLQRPGDSRRHMNQLHEFRYIPKGDPRDYAVKSKSGRRLTLLHKSRELTVDEQSGAVYRCLFRDRAGNTVKEIIHEGFATRPGGILFPSLSIIASYGPGGILQAITVMQLEQSSFNSPLPADAFEVAAPKDATLFDFRSGSPRSFPISEPAPDVVKVADTKFLPPHPGQPGDLAHKGFASRYQTLILLGAAVAILTLLIVWRRRNSS